MDPDSLPDDIRKRHQAGTDAMRQKWLDGLSDEGRNKLSAARKEVLASLQPFGQRE